LSESGMKRSKADLINSLTQTFNSINPSLEKYERLEKAVIMKEHWTVSNNKITPSLKVKRNEIEKIHLPTYSTWYDKPGLVIWE